MCAVNQDLGPDIQFSVNHCTQFKWGYASLSHLLPMYHYAPEIYKNVCVYIHIHKHTPDVDQNPICNTV